MPTTFPRPLFFSLLAAAALASAPAQAAPADNFRIGMAQYPSSLHPLYDAMVAKSLVTGATLRPVTTHDSNWQVTCLLCTELPSVEKGTARVETLTTGKKGIIATYTLRDDLSWGDGTPLTTRDIVFAWDVGRHPQSGVSNGEFFSKDIGEVRALDELTFEVVFTKEACDFAAINDFYPLPEHLERAVFEKDPKNYINATLYNTDPANPGLWMGPYRVAKVETGASLTLEKNADWQGEAPAFKTVTFRAIENSAALAANLLSGEIDYIAGELGLSLDQAVAFEKRLPKGAYDVTYKPGLTYEHIDFRLDDPVFADLRLRQALMYAMNRDAINNQIFGGRQQPAHSNINPLDTVYAVDVQKYPYDPAKAAALLDEAGWKRRDDGLRYNDKGEALTITLTTTAGNKSRETIQQAIQADWKKVGVQAVIDNKPPRVLFGDMMRERAFKGGVMYAWMSSPKNVPKTTLHSGMIPSAANNFAGQNYPGYSDPAMDKIIDDLSVVCEEGANRQLWTQLQQKYAQELPALPLYYRADSFFVPKWLAGVTPTGHMHPSTLWIETWKIKE